MTLVLFNNHSISLAKPVMIAAALVAVLLLAACGGSDAKDPLELVPARANLIASADLPTILNDADVATGYGLLAANDAAHLKALNNLLSAFGLDKRHASIAVEPASEPSTRSGAIVFTGSPFAWLSRLFRRGS